MVFCSSLGLQVIIICLVILDALLVLAELILDLKIIQPDKNNYAARVVCPPICHLHRGEQCGAESTCLVRE